MWYIKQNLQLPVSIWTIIPTPVTIETRVKVDMWQSRVGIEHYILLRISIALLRSKRCSTVFSL